MHYKNLMRHKFLPLLVALVLHTNAFAQQPTAATQQTQQAQQQPSKPASANAPDVERLRAHVKYLASEKLEGRKTGTPPAGEAAAYVATELAKYNVKFARPTGSGHATGVTDTGYLRTFPYIASVELGKANAMTFASRAADTATTTNAAPAVAMLDLRPGEDWMPLGWSANGRAENLPAAFVGYGIASSEQNYDDYAGLDVTGRIVVALAGTPDGDNPHGQFTRFNEPRLKAAAARERGARALLLIANAEDFKDERLARLRYDNSGGDAGLPVAVISRASARRILEAGGIALPLEQLQKPPQHQPPQTTPPSTPLHQPSQHSTPQPSEQTSASSGQPSATSGQMSAASPSPRQNFSAVLRDVTLSVAVDLVRQKAAAFNVVGTLEGADAKLKNEYVVIGAHYDHLGRGGAGSLAAREGDIHFGADDNASGVAALLELARLLSAERPRLRRSVVFIAFGGEEEGLLGSSYYVNNPVVPLAETVAMINLDMVGRLKDEKLLIGGIGTARQWRDWIGEANRELDIKVTTTASNHGDGQQAGRDASKEGSGVPVVYGANGQLVATAKPRERFALTLNDDGYGPSDHSSFYAKKIPVLFFFTGTHEDYHKPTDTAERLNYEGEARIVGFVRDIFHSIDRSDERPAYAVTRSEGAGRSTGFRVYLGTIPSYAESETGLKLDAVRDDSPASRAGLRAGDVIVKLAGRDVRNVYDYTNALSEMRAGQEYEVEALRDGQRLSLKLTPAARR
jgi:hypothetical protein